MKIGNHIYAVIGHVKVIRVRVTDVKEELSGEDGEERKLVLSTVLDMPTKADEITVSDRNIHTLYLRNIDVVDGKFVRSGIFEDYDKAEERAKFILNDFIKEKEIELAGLHGSMHDLSKNVVW